MRGNIILTGMPGAGKSSAGVLAAKALGMRFVDTDLLIQERTGMLLCEILEKRGRAEFLRIEEEVLLSLDASATVADRTVTGGTVVATGGSAVLSAAAMKRLGETGGIIYLRVELPELVRRISNISTRGIVMEANETLADIFAVREPLYLKYAETVIDVRGALEDTVRRIVETARTDLRLSY